MSKGASPALALVSTLLGLTLLFAMATSWPQIYAAVGMRYVDDATGSDDSDCSNPANPCKTIGYALAQATDGDEIRVAQGTYMETLDVAISVAFRGGYEAAGWTRDVDASATILDASASNDSAIDILPHVDVFIEGLTVQGTDHTGADGHGGIAIDRATVVVSGTIVQHNNAKANGGGIYLQDGGESASLKVINSSILHNEAAAGGGIATSGQPTITLESARVEGNSAVLDGGGIMASWLVATGTQIVSNTSGTSGGGISADRAWIYDSQIMGNEVSGVGQTDGGGMAIYAELHLENSLVSNNQAMGTMSSGASGFSVANGTATVLNSRISDNKKGNVAIGLWSSEFDLVNALVVQNEGHGIAGDGRALRGTMMNVTVAGNEDRGVWLESAAVSITNSIVWGNGDIDNECGSNCAITYSDIGSGDGTGTGNISEDPQVLDWAGGDWHLQGTSPCIDRGTSLGAPLHDIEGTARDTLPDMGAYEWACSLVWLPVVRRGPELHVHVMVDAREEDKYLQALRSFETQTGIDLAVEGVDSLEAVLPILADAGELPDAAVLPRSGVVLDSLNRQGYTMDPSTWLGRVYLLQQYQPSWLDMATMEHGMAGLWYKASTCSLVWYPAREFQAAGYQVPQTWDDLLSLSEQMVADGRTPWCIGIESGAASGWVGTDWVEDIMLRTVSPEDYDRWVQGELKFLSPEVRTAFEIMANIWFDDDYVLGGRTSIPTTFFGDAPNPMFDDPPSCWLHRQADFISGFFPEGVQFGTDYDYFHLPPIDPQYGAPMLVRGDLFAFFQDRPEVRTFAAYVSTGKSVRWWVERGLAVSPHTDASLAWYPAAARGYAEMLRTAGVVRHDGSDLMPPEVGFGSFWTGIVDYVNGQNLDTILTTIDASWPHSAREGGTGVLAGQRIAPKIGTPVSAEVARDHDQRPPAGLDRTPRWE